MIASHAITLFIVLGSFSVTKHVNYLPVSTDGCTNTTFSSHIEPFFEQQYELYKTSAAINGTVPPSLESSTSTQYVL